MQEYKEALQKYTDFKGRSTRKAFWMFTLYNMLISMGLSIIFGMIHAQPLIHVYNLILLLPSSAVTVRRLHDIGKSAWSLLWILFPVIGWVVLIVFYCTDSQPGTNKYGLSPKETHTATQNPVV